MDKREHHEEIPSKVDLQTFAIERKMEVEHQIRPHNIEYIPECDFVLTGDRGCKLTLWNARNMSMVTQTTVHWDKISCLKYIKDRKEIICAFGDGYLKMFKIVEKV